MQVNWLVSAFARFVLGWAVVWAAAGVIPAENAPSQIPVAVSGLLGPSYQVGPNDELTIRCQEVEEITEKPVRIDSDGDISLPLLGRFRVAGLTVAQLEEDLKGRLRKFAYEPLVSVAVTQYGSQPVSVVGAVQTPGTYQLRGAKNLVEVISMAGGLRNDAGRWASVTRRQDSGVLPVPGAHPDASGGYSVAEVDVQAAMSGNPESNLAVRPFDVVSVARAHLVYAIGEVKKPGGFVLTGGQDVSVLQVVSMAEGVLSTGAPKRAKILRGSADNGHKVEVPVDLAKIMQGQAPDPQMNPEDILVVPSNKPRNAGLRALEVVIQTGTGVVIYRR